MAGTTIHIPFRPASQNSCSRKKRASSASNLTRANAALPGSHGGSLDPEGDVGVGRLCMSPAVQELSVPVQRVQRSYSRCVLPAYDCDS